MAVGVFSYTHLFILLAENLMEEDTSHKLKSTALMQVQYIIHFVTANFLSCDIITCKILDRSDSIESKLRRINGSFDNIVKI